MSVLLLCRSLDVGGTERQIVALAKRSHLQGHRVAVAIFYPNGALASDLYAAGVTVFDLNKSGRWDVLPFLFRLMRLVRTWKPKTIYSFLGGPNILTVCIKPFLRGVAIVWGVRASRVDLHRYDWLLRASYRIECQLSRFASLIICNSIAGLEYAAAHGFPRKKMIVIPNGIDTETFKPDPGARWRIRRDWGIADSEILVGLVARLDPMKDHATFLYAAAMVATRRPNIRFVCVGDGPSFFTIQLHRLGAELGLAEKLTWAGMCRDAPAVFSALDIAVSSSCGEGFSNVIAEAMACGAPCVVTDVGDSKAIVDQLGIVVNPGSPAELCDGIDRMVERLTPAVRGAVRASIVNRFNTEIMVTATLNALGRLT